MEPVRNQSIFSRFCSCFTFRAGRANRARQIQVAPSKVDLVVREAFTNIEAPSTKRLPPPLFAAESLPSSSAELSPQKPQRFSRTISIQEARSWIHREDETSFNCHITLSGTGELELFAERPRFLCSEKSPFLACVVESTFREAVTGARLITISDATSEWTANECKELERQEDLLGNLGDALTLNQRNQLRSCREKLARYRGLSPANPPVIEVVKNETAANVQELYLHPIDRHLFFSHLEKPDPSKDSPIFFANPKSPFLAFRIQAHFLEPFSSTLFLTIKDASEEWIAEKLREEVSPEKRTCYERYLAKKNFTSKPARSSVVTIDETTQKTLPKLHIAVIDDAMMPRRCLNKQLSPYTVEGKVFEAVDGGESTDTLLNDHGDDIDLIFLDYDMPGRNGIEVLRLIKENPKLASISVIFLSARPPGHETEAIDAEIGRLSDARLVKPASAKEVTDTLQQVFLTHAKSPLRRFRRHLVSD